MRTSLSRLLAVLVTAGTLPACTQGEGDRCQLNSDCDFPTFTCAVPEGMRNIGGTCQRSGTGQDFAMPPPDASGTEQPDLTASPDMPTDMTVPPGQDMPDMAVEPDLLGIDGAQPGG